MISHSIDQAAAPGVHRPMSLLLQALKQIELKAPSEAMLARATGELGNVSELSPSPEPPDALAPSVSEALSAIGSSTVVHPSPCAEMAVESCDVSIAVIRQYQNEEADSVMAHAGPFELPTLPVVEVQESTTRPAVRPRRDVYRLGEQVLSLLADDAPAAIAVISSGDEAPSALICEIGKGLAAVDRGEVLAITVEIDLPARSKDNATFSDVVAARTRWQDAVSRTPHDRFSLLARGDLQPAAISSRRRLLNVWQELGERFAYVVFEAHANELDAILPFLATFDAAFLAVVLNGTRRADVERLATRIRASGCHLCGCLVR